LRYRERSEGKRGVLYLDERKRPRRKREEKDVPERELENLKPVSQVKLKTVMAEIKPVGRSCQASH
jgi:hypothetical protein